MGDGRAGPILLGLRVKLQAMQPHEVGFCGIMMRMPAGGGRLETLHHMTSGIHAARCIHAASGSHPGRVL